MPLVTIPCARALFFENDSPTKARLGTYRRPAPRPMQTPCARKTCQYVLHKLSMKMPKTTPKLPTKSIVRYQPRSKSGPERQPTRMSSHDWTVPIQLMAEGEEEESSF